MRFRLRNAVGWIAIVRNPPFIPNFLSEMGHFRLVSAKMLQHMARKRALIGKRLLLFRRNLQLFLKKLLLLLRSLQLPWYKLQLIAGKRALLG